jgi:DNA-binding LytR/AlgR family response regulator
MKVLIIEDEKPAAKRITKLVKALDTNIEIVDIIDAVEDAVSWFNNYPMPDLVFMDIQLADGLSFDIFKGVQVTCPVIFTTAYDEYALEAFKVNSIDYLLKPIEEKALQKAWDKFQLLRKSSNSDIQGLLESFKSMNEQKKYKERFLVKKGDGYKYIKIDKIAYFYSEDGLTFIKTFEKERYIIDEKMNQLELGLHPRHYFRINRKLIISDQAVKDIVNYFNNRLKLELNPSFDKEVIVSRERVVAFKAWLQD